MGDQNHDIEKYLRGELTPAEMHALEKKALDDPFLADAIDGIENVKSTEFIADVRQLQDQINKRTSMEDKTLIIPLWTWISRVAAGLLILCISGYIIFGLVDKTEKPTLLSLNKSEKQPSPKQPQQEPETTQTNEKEINVKKDEEKKPFSSSAFSSPLKHRAEKQSELLNKNEIASDSVSTMPMQGKATTEGFIAMDKKLNLEETEALKDVTLSTPPREDRVMLETTRRKSRRDAADLSPSVSQAPTMSVADKKVIAKVVQGTVKDADDGQPLPGVNVTIKGTNDGVVTDADGNYQIPLEDLKTELVFSFIGMQSIDVPVDDKETVDVKMEQDVSQLSEVVVVGYAAKSDGLEKEEEANIYQLAEPAGGRKAFKKYLIENLKYPELAVENKIQGKVTIQFTVEQSGVVNDFRILKGIGYGCDEEVIRLVRQGPKWTPTKRNDEPLKGKVKVRLRFQLPD